MPAGPGLTAADQILWAQRIRKEEAVNAKATGKFSIRSVIRSEDVPKRFKPGHQDPGNPASSVGFHPKSKEGRQLKSDLHMLQAPPKGKYPWPETSYQDHGWMQKDFGTEVSPDGLKTLAGLEPAVGLGWKGRPSDDPLRFTKVAYGAKDQPSDGPLPPYEVQAPSGPKAQRERCPFGAFDAEATKVAREKSAARRAARSASSSLVAAAREGQKTPSAASSKAAAHPWKNTSSEPDFAKLLQIASTAARPGATDRDMQQALERSRIFYNRHPKYERWYKPLSNSDVATFADSFTKCWGLQFYERSAMRNT